MSDPLTGRTFGGRYEILDRVGEGGMAVVYRGRDMLLGRLVAVKVLRDQFASDEAFLERFRLEARAAASLSHPHVVSIFDVGEDAGNHYIVMEHVEGSNLKDIICRNETLSPSKVAQIATGIVQALKAAHSRDLIHRDIKPHNILITRDGTVKVTDFGIARAAAVSSFTETGMVIGSVHYFSPEQARGDDVDPATDLYSLGVVMFEMLTGTLPFTGDNPVAVAIKHLQEPPPVPSSINPNIPPALEAIVVRLLQKNPEKRYAGADDLLADLAATTFAPPRDEQPFLPVNPSPEGTALDDPETTLVMTAAKADHTRIARRRQRRREHDVSDHKHPKKRRRWLFGAFVVMLFVGLIFAALEILPDIIFPAEVDVPDIVGLDLDGAQQQLSSVGLRLVHDGAYAYSALDAGMVVRQEPEADHRVRMGRQIRVVVSRGPEMTVVPDLIGLPKIEAQLLITTERLTMGGIVEQFAPDERPNTVIGQNPPPGESLMAGQSIEIIVAQGSEPESTVRMPDVRGMLLDEAQQYLKELGFAEGQLHEEPHPTAAEHEVIDQNPSAGEMVEAGYPYALAYAASPSDSAGVVSSATTSTEDKNWENRILINVPNGPAREVVIVVIDDFGPRQVFREARRGGSRFYETVRLRGDLARVQVWFDGEEQMNQQLKRPGSGL